MTNFIWCVFLYVRAGMCACGCMRGMVQAGYTYDSFCAWRCVWLSLSSQVHADVHAIEEKLHQIRNTVNQNQTTAAGSR